ncbi:hypothetical protein NE237_000517 [Protea cynaroides]|uniref:Uncharacterized protein n=1 Tax=Protea cynaroides TaxID=273540 RepID=A0A9Q0KSF0_9MAGN|nr:hypothetical protein NE237_000517 [Protea cynaroides]
MHDNVVLNGLFVRSVGVSLRFPHSAGVSLLATEFPICYYFGESRPSDVFCPWLDLKSVFYAIARVLLLFYIWSSSSIPLYRFHKFDRNYWTQTFSADHVHERYRNVFL